MITVSAPGKLMLFGEHAVVYGRPCIVTAISERLTVTEGESSGDTRFLDAAVTLWGKGQHLKASSSFSGMYGFGSSSAVTVAALKFLRPEASNKELFNAAPGIAEPVSLLAIHLDRHRDCGARKSVETMARPLDCCLVASRRTLHVRP